MFENRFQFRLGLALAVCFAIACLGSNSSYGQEAKKQRVQIQVQLKPASPPSVPGSTAPGEATPAAGTPAEPPKPRPVDPNDPKIVLETLDEHYLGAQHQGYGATSMPRFFGAKIVVVNLTPNEVVLKPTDFEILVDGEVRKNGPVPDNIKGYSIPVREKHISFGEFQADPEVKIASGLTATVKVFADGIYSGTKLPKLEVVLKHADQTIRLDVNEAARTNLKLDLKKIGPMDCLALVSIGGELGDISYGILVDALDQLAAQKMQRVVIHFAEGTKAVPQHLSGWMAQSVNAQGRDFGGEMPFLGFPSSIREIHLTKFPSAQNQPQGVYYSPYGPVPSNQGKIHETLEQAVRAALKTVFEALPRAQVVAEMNNGHPLSRLAALSHGAARLGADQLGTILSLTSSEDLSIQDASLAALQHFGEPEAIGTLVEFVRKGVDPSATTAATSLVVSRYSEATIALEELLKSEPEQSRRRIISVLAKNPQPIWAEAIYSQAQHPTPEVAMEAIRALKVVGHPKYFELLKQGLASQNEQIRNETFALTAGDSDRDIEELATNYTLEWVKTKSPDGNMVSLIQRTKDARFLPALKALFETGTDRSTILSTLLAIGDFSTNEGIINKYPMLESHEKAQVLTWLIRIRSPEFLKFAKEALGTEDYNLLYPATQGLMEDGGPEAQQVLIDAIKLNPKQQVVAQVCNALGMFNSPEARAALIELRDKGPEDLRNFGVSALQNMRNRSPSMQYVYQGQSWLQQKNYKEALDSYNAAIEGDPELPEAYSGRADCYMKQEKFEEAGKDYTKALELDPFNAMAAAGICIVKVQGGKLDEGIKDIEEARKKFPNNGMFTYNAACVYGRSIEYLKKQPESPETTAKIKEFETKAIADLKTAIEQGYRDMNWMKEDPDLKSLHENPEFKKLATAGEEEAKEEDGPIQVLEE